MAEAAERLGISEPAVRKRVTRGTLQSEKDAAGRVYVLLDTGQPDGQPTGHPGGEEQDPAAGRYTQSLEEQVAYLREQLQEERQARREESRELRRLLAGLIERVPELEAPQEGRQESPSEGSIPQEDRPVREEPAEPPQRPWWRRLWRT